MRNILLASAMLIVPLSARGQTTAAATPAAATSTATGCSNAVPNYAASAGGFGTLGGQIYSPDGQPFIARGIDVMYGNGNPSAAQIQASFPGTNFVRLAIYNYDSPASLTAYVNDLTSHGIVVELENHDNGAGNAGGGQGTIFTGSALAQEQAWYSSVASAFKTNPYVWFGTNNEPSEVNSSGQTDPAALSAWQQTTYNTIRAAGNNAPIMLEANSWGPGRTNVGYTASAYAGMTNVIWDLHYYGWVSGYSTSQSTVLVNALHHDFRHNGDPQCGRADPGYSSANTATQRPDRRSTRTAARSSQRCSKAASAAPPGPGAPATPATA